jgi:hypothetical protein
MVRARRTIWKSPRVRNYLYISDSKVDSYLPQFSAAEKRRIAAKFGFNVGVLGASVEGELMPLSNRVHRLEAVEKKLRAEKPVGHHVGDSTSWIE